MVDGQIASRGIRDAALLAAMREIPRELFVPPGLEREAYTDRALPIGWQQTISQAYIVAVMLEALDLHGRERVLEVGSGSGYAAALLSRLAARVFTIERLPELAAAAALRLRRLGIDNVEVICGDGTRGLPEQAPFDAIVVAAGAGELPKALREQLVIGGRLVIPVGSNRELQMLRSIRRVDADRFEESELGLCCFVPLVGAESGTSA